MLNPRQVQAISDWKPNYLYLPEMEVLYENVRYRCLIQHTSSNSFDFDFDSNKWVAELAGLFARTQLEPTGFQNREKTLIEFDEVTRTFTISPKNDQFDYWIQGKQYFKYSSESIVIPDEEGGYYIFYDGESLVSSINTPNLYLTFGVALIAYVYWAKDMHTAIIFGDERHGLTMDWATHAYIHNAFGTQFIQGLGLTNLLVNKSGNEDSHAQFGVADGAIVDADLIHTIINSNTEMLQPFCQIPIFYRWGANGEWRSKAADSFPLIYSGTAGYNGYRLPYNSFDGGVYGFTEVPNRDFVLIHIFATHDLRHPIIGVLGIATYPRIGAAKRAAAIEAIEIKDLPFTKFCLIGTVIFQTSNGYSNIPHARIRSVDSNDSEYMDFRKQNMQQVSSVAAVGTGSWQILVDEDQINWDVGKDDSAEITLGGDRILKNPINLTSGATYNLVVKQDDVGGRQLNFGDVYKFENQTIPILTSTPNAMDILEFFSDGLFMFCKCFKNYG